jgi:hypothetical protein
VPFTIHVTAVFALPVTAAVNCWVPKFATLATAGDTVTVTVVGAAVGVTITVADPDFVVSLWEVAEIVTCAGVGTEAGAVYNPVLETVPLALPPATLHVTAVFDVSITVAVNCSVVPITTFTSVGNTVTLTTRPAVPLLHPASIVTSMNASSEQPRFMTISAQVGEFLL